MLFLIFHNRLNNRKKIKVNKNKRNVAMCVQYNEDVALAWRRKAHCVAYLQQSETVDQAKAGEHHS